MITDDNKKLAQWAMEYALKNGCPLCQFLIVVCNHVFN